MAIELPADKIIIDVTDNPELQSYFARKEAGDICSGKFKAAVDEVGDRVILSLTGEGTELTMDAYKDDKKPKPGAKKSVAESVMEDNAETRMMSETPAKQVSTETMTA